ncbi:hypothetical protein [Mesorhizobium sp. 1M-11]|uniref:hypothetical protein n=1 Tax=Mesorhizobium sp. 1M-11 TaxID=1529006 RepID=UPI0006C74BC4|nr:hypothetical protein [Mesorhizobium sp. 1M-11]
MLERYRLASDALKVPMPDRNGRLFSTDGETVDTEHPFYAALIADGDIVKEPQPAAGGQRKGKDNGPV